MVEKCQTGFKGFDHNFCCRGMQYATGAEFAITNKKKLEMCENGLHFCVKPTDVLRYYPPFFGDERTRYATVTATGKVVESFYKCVARKLQIHDEYSLLDLAPGGDNYYSINYTDYTPVRCDCRGKRYLQPTVAYAPGSIFESEGDVIALEEHSIAKSQHKNAICLSVGSYAYTNEGSNSVALVTDHSSIAEAVGGYAVAAAPRSLASARTWQNYGLISRGVALGKHYAEALSSGSVAITENYARGVKGSLLVFLLMNEPTVRAFLVDGKAIKEHTWYACNTDGAIYEVNF